MKHCNNWLHVMNANLHIVENSGGDAEQPQFVTSEGSVVTWVFQNENIASLKAILIHVPRSRVCNDRFLTVPQTQQD